MRFGPCMCGDTACPSCGPAQGYDLGFELVCEWLDEVLCSSDNVYDELSPFVDHIAEVLGEVSDELRNALVLEANKWKREKR